MPMRIVRNDITKMKVDAIVDATHPTLEGIRDIGGGIAGRLRGVFRPDLSEKTEEPGKQTEKSANPRAADDSADGRRTVPVKITRAGRLPCRYVIHAAGPRWQGGKQGETEQLAACYRSALLLAARQRLRTVAFPLIGSGIHGFPRTLALQIAADTIREFLMEHEMTVILVIFDRQSSLIAGKLFADISHYIDDRYAETHENSFTQLLRQVPEENRKENQALSLDEALKQIDESFSEMLLRKIDEKGMKDSECYKRANIDRKLFSKIRRDRLYRPSKPTAVAFAIALELSLDETREMLMKAGFALSHSSKFDIIIEYFIQRGNYNIFEINEALFAFDQNLLGG